MTPRLVSQQLFAMLMIIIGSSTIVAALAVTVEEHRPIGHVANADSKVDVFRGKQVYKNWCASCHGRYLQGQPLWQIADQNAARRAPPLDQTGHAWYQSDEALFGMTKYGQYGKSTVAGSAMPAFVARLTDEDILASIAFIKARWPKGLKFLQAMRNPGQGAYPTKTVQSDWRFPPACLPVRAPIKDFERPPV